MKLVLDVGQEMTTVEEAVYGHGRGDKPKKKTRKITYGLSFFGDLYSLAAEFLTVAKKYQ